MLKDPWELLKKARDRLVDAEARCGADLPDIEVVRGLIDAILESDEPTPAEILRILGHELKGPLAAMVALLSSVSDGYLDSDPVRAREMVDRARRRAEELLPLVDDIMDLGSLAAGGESIPRTMVDLATLCSGVLHLWRPFFEQKGMRLTGDIAEGPLVVRGYQTFLRRVVTNLVMNAFKYNRPGGEVTMELTREGAEAELRVSDTGVGIPAEDLPHIFSFLYRGRQARRNPDGGLGLGLSLVRKIVEAHDGSITAESEFDRGTTMIVRLPLDAHPHS